MTDATPADVAAEDQWLDQRRHEIMTTDYATLLRDIIRVATAALMQVETEGHDWRVDAALAWIADAAEGKPYA